MRLPFSGTYPVTQNFLEHEARKILNGWQYYNGGIDWATPERTPVYAALTGTVSKIEMLNTGYGNVIKIDHEAGLQTLYAHLSYIVTTLGASVEQGQMIGRTGNTGNSTGPHIHFEVRQDGIAIDPQPLINGTATLEIPPDYIPENILRVVAEYGANIRLTPMRSNNLVATLPKGYRIERVEGVETIVTDGIEWVPVKLWMARKDEDGTVLLV